MASWETARMYLRDILENAARSGSGPGVVPLSNVKRLFHSRFHLELSETMLGHSKLSELLQDPKFHDVCTVQLQSHGYIVVQKQPQHAGVLNAQTTPQCAPPAINTRHAAGSNSASWTAQAD